MDAEHEPGMIQIEVAYANPDKQIIRAVSVASGTTVAEAIELTAIKDEFPGIKINPGAGRITVSKILDWFEGDFKADGGVLEVIAHYIDQEDATWLRTNGQKASIQYFKYDWSLNEQHLKTKR